MVYLATFLAMVHLTKCVQSQQWSTDVIVIVMKGQWIDLKWNYKFHQQEIDTLTVSIWYELRSPLNARCW